MSVGVMYECVDCGQELFHCSVCHCLFHVTEMGFVSEQKSYCAGCKREALEKAPVKITIRRRPQNLARLRVVRKI